MYNTTTLHSNKLGGKDDPLGMLKGFERNQTHTGTRVMCKGLLSGSSTLITVARRAVAISDNVKSMSGGKGEKRKAPAKITRSTIHSFIHSENNLKPHSPFFFSF